MKRIPALIAALLFLPASLYAIEPTPCGPATRKAWAEYRLAVSKAKPGTPLYVPRPFPTTDDEVLTDFRFVYFRMFGSDAPDQLPAAEAPVLKGLKTGTLRLTVTRVENWTPTRCGQIERQWDYVIRVFTREGVELGRYALGQSGLFTQASVPAPSLRPDLLRGWRKEFSTTDEVTHNARRFFGVEGSQPRLVSIEGDGDLRCESTHPCAALSAGTRVYLMGRIVPWKSADTPPQLYELRTDKPRFSPTEVASPDGRAAAMRSLGQGERLVSFAADGFMVATPVASVVQAK
jgi:hypothetical protein